MVPPLHQPTARGLLRLSCQAQRYEWGRPASESEVAQLAKANGSEVDESKPYAELWMGTHPNCPARVAGSGQLLSDWIKANSACLGSPVIQHFGTDLPFLFKVLSVNKALSIQSHPDKQLAAQLHKQHPQLYADDNHKPEMALALSDDFQALCSFAPLPNILCALDAHPELAGVVGSSRVEQLRAAASEDAQKQALRAAFTALMTAPPEQVKAAVSSLVARLQQQQAVSGPLAGHEALALTLDQQYPGGDVGILAAFFLNLVRLRAGQALYLGANEPHAYLSGELVECMATSDNVIRAGLTPKFKHAEVLCKSLTYNTGEPEVLEGRAISSSPAGTLRVYRPPTEEFEIRHVTVPAPQAGATTPTPAAFHLAADPGPQLLMVQRGRGTARVAGAGAAHAATPAALEEETTLSRGAVLFVPAGTALELRAETGSSEALSIWVSAVNATFFALHAALSPAPRVKTVYMAPSYTGTGKASTLSSPTSPAAARSVLFSSPQAAAAMTGSPVLAQQIVAS